MKYENEDLSVFDRPLSAFHSEYYLVDIDATLTMMRPEAITPERRLHGSAIFRLFFEMMTERGRDPEEASEAIRTYAEQVVFWDYPDFIAEFDLPAVEAFERIHAWHRENILPCRGVELVKRLAADGRKLYIMSNNPYSGCLFKLQAVGLADSDYRSKYFTGIFGTDVLRGCKNVPAVWKRAFARIPARTEEIGVIGDNPVEDGEIPMSVGAGECIILPPGILA